VAFLFCTTAVLLPEDFPPRGGLRLLNKRRGAEDAEKGGGILEISFRSSFTQPPMRNVVSANLSVLCDSALRFFEKLMRFTL
jgi:hypothetical protein